MLHQQSSWTTQAVATHIRQAVLTLKKLPAVSIKAYVSAWPDIVRQPHEVAYMEPTPIRCRATPDEITQLEQVFDWMRWIAVEERKLVWKRAMQVPWRTICWELGCDRKTAWRKQHAALTKIAIQLNAKLNTPLKQP